jgi:hypothetical protein
VLADAGHQDAVVQAANFIGRNTLSAAQSYALLYNLGEGLYRTRSSLALVDAQNTLQPFYSGALNLATDPSQSEAARVASPNRVNRYATESATVARVSDKLGLRK